MKNFIPIVLVLPALLACGPQTSAPTDQAPGVDSMVNSATEVMVYTTAKDTDKRLSLTDKLTFEPGVQPFENEVEVNLEVRVCKF